MVYHFEDSLGRKMEVASRLMSNRLTQRLKNFEIPVTAEQWGLLSILFEEDGISQNQLASKMFKDHTSISRIVDNLIKKSLIIRKYDPTDRRTNLIYITETGAKLKDQIMEEVQQHIAASFQGITEEQLKICSEVMQKVIQNLE